MNQGAIMENQNTSVQDNYCSPEKVLSPCFGSPEVIRDTPNLRG